MKRNALNKPGKPAIRKRHWCLGTAMIIFGSWITHSTTAMISHQHANQQAQQLAQAMPSSNPTLMGGLPSGAFIESLQTSLGPVSDNYTLTSPALHLFTNDGSANFKSTEYQIKRGDTLGNIFKNFGFSHALAHEIGLHETAKTLTQLSIGSTLTFKQDEQNILREIVYPINNLQNFVLRIKDTSIDDAFIHDLPYRTSERTVSGEINSSLYEAALDAGLSIELIMSMVQIFGWDIDFVLDIRAGDTFHVIYEEHRMNGKHLSNGVILAAEFNTQNERYRAIRYVNQDHEASYYNPQGQSMLGTFLRSPVEFSRISSRFGRRKHPILKKWRAHRGVDYAASRGTPIRATADGKIIHAGNKGGYGRTVILKHADRFTTLYAHMQGFAKGIRSGQRVKQGDTIGYIGSTGLATGPHLHYEFRLDGVHRNPLTYKTPKASAVEASELPLFKQVASLQLAHLDSLSSNYQLARKTFED